MKTVLVFCTFDVVHPGHLFFLQQAARHGDELVVVIARDSRVLLEKGKLPYFNEKERLAVVRQLKVVTRALLGNKPGTHTMLKKIKPDVICVGHDQKKHINKIPSHIKVIGIPAKNRARWKSSKIKLK